MNAVVDPAESVALWVVDPNPRAHAFYRKHGFVADGTAQFEDGVREIRMVRDVQRRYSPAVPGVDLGSRVAGAASVVQQGHDLRPWVR